MSLSKQAFEEEQDRLERPDAYPHLEFEDRVHLIELLKRSLQPLDVHDDAKLLSYRQGLIAQLEGGDSVLIPKGPSVAPDREIPLLGALRPYLERSCLEDFYDHLNGSDEITMRLMLRLCHARQA